MSVEAYSGELAYQSQRLANVIENLFDVAVADGVDFNYPCYSGLSLPPVDNQHRAAGLPNTDTLSYKQIIKPGPYIWGGEAEIMSLSRHDHPDLAGQTHYMLTLGHFGGHDKPLTESRVLTIEGSAIYGVRLVGGLNGSVEPEGMDELEATAVALSVLSGLRSELSRHRAAQTVRGSYINHSQAASF